MRYSTFIIYQDICKIVLLLVYKTNYLKSRAWSVRTFVYTNACVRAGGVCVCMRVDVGTLYVCMYVFVYMCLCECVFVYG